MLGAAECSLYSELSKLLDPGLGELSGWWETKHRGHRAGGCLRPTVCDSVLYEVVCTQGDTCCRYELGETSPVTSGCVTGSLA